MRITALAAVLAVAALPALAANARNPYGNVDRRVDAGNDTGDSQVDRLNEAQLNGGGYAPGRRPLAVQPGYPAPAYAPPGYAAPPPGAYYPPYPQATYAPPPYAYYRAPYGVAPRPYYPY